MWQALVRWLGAEVIKQLISAAKDAYYKWQEEKAKKKREETRAKREQLLISLEVARQNGDIAAVDRISTELSELPAD